MLSDLECIVCANGRLVYMYDEDRSKVFLECEECMTGYWDVAGPADIFRTEDSQAATRLARLEEITRAQRSDGGSPP